MSGTRARDKWGQTLEHSGFQIVPNLLLTVQSRLGLSSTEIVLLLHINRYWWHRDQDPFPSSAGIARQMGLHIRSVERHLKSLEKKELIYRHEPRWISGKKVGPISLVPLAQSLEEVAKELELRRSRIQDDGSSPVPERPHPSGTASGASSKEAPL